MKENRTQQRFLVPPLCPCQPWPAHSSRMRGGEERLYARGISCRFCLLIMLAFKLQLCIGEGGAQKFRLAGQNLKLRIPRPVPLRRPAAFITALRGGNEESSAPLATGIAHFKVVYPPRSCVGQSDLPCFAVPLHRQISISKMYVDSQTVAAGRIRVDAIGASVWVVGQLEGPHLFNPRSHRSPLERASFPS